MHVMRKGMLRKQAAGRNTAPNTCHCRWPPPMLIAAYG
eukprot:CAMPEP_0184377226 /NCGR_PEP_ID=MMETSP0007-20130409/2098_1 /TAXON_ID=97485 /ORGANISM="Prymnesium parvum, Strain Texoma1" /LENGTH=37 /DNA_ID= /DNA_START= /DNA_END= /DNA_ORIENTATION=